VLAGKNSAALIHRSLGPAQAGCLIQVKKSTGYYFCLSYTGEGNIVDVLELASAATSASSAFSRA
jgi:small subunit ribosomal protein S6